MTVLSTGYKTLTDMLKESGNPGLVLTANTLAKNSPLIQDMPLLQASDSTVHRMNQGVLLPSGAWVGFNQGSSIAKGTRQSFLEPICTYESRSAVEQKLYDAQVNPELYRSEEDMDHLEGAAQAIESKIIYGVNAVTPDAPNGLEIKLRTLNTTKTSGPIVVSHGGSATLSSLYFVSWGPRKVYGAYPRAHASAGLKRTDLGLVSITDPNDSTALMEVYMTKFNMSLGVCVHNFQYLARLANINVAGTFDEDKFIELVNYLPTNGQFTIYGNDAVAAMLQKRIVAKPNVLFSSQMDAFGNRVETLMGMPFKRTDAILSTETQLT